MSQNNKRGNEILFDRVALALNIEEFLPSRKARDQSAPPLLPQNLHILTREPAVYYFSPLTISINTCSMNSPILQSITSKFTS